MSDKKDFFSGIASKLALLMGGAVLVTGAQASTNVVSTSAPDANNIILNATGVTEAAPCKVDLEAAIRRLQTHCCAWLSLLAFIPQFSLFPLLARCLING